MAILEDGIPTRINTSALATISIKEFEQITNTTNVLHAPPTRLSAKELKAKRREAAEKRSFAQKMLQALKKPKVTRFLKPTPIAEVFIPIQK